jgi:putative nucleotidyltransferase with HDIG domain
VDMVNASTPETAGRASRVELILSQMESLPTLPAVAVRLVQLTTDRHANSKQIVGLIESDPALTAKILKLARRADSGIRPDAARTVERAVVMLGFDTVRNTILSIKVFEVFGPDAAREDTGLFDRQDFWKHSLAVGCAAKLLAVRLSIKIDPEEAFVCGLLHDLGKVALDTILPKSYSRVVDSARTERVAISDIENRLLGVDHTVVGRRLGQRWGLPESILSTMWLHHQDPETLPRAVPGREYARLVYLADLMVREHRIGFSGNFVFAHTARELAGRMHIGPTDFDYVLQRLAEDIEQRADLLGLQKITKDSLYLKALSDANAELGRLNEQFSASNRQLQRRSKYFGVLGQLTKDLGRRNDLASLCGVCAKALCGALECSAGAVLSVDRSGICAVGHFVDNRVGEYWSRLGARQPEMTFEDTVAPRAFNLQPVAADDPRLAVCEEHLPQGTIWLVDLATGANWHSMALLAASTDQVAQWENQATELDALTGQIQLALRQAVMMQHAQELAEALAEEARNLHEAEPQKLRRRSLDIIAEMAAGAWHEMNNPLAIISGRAQLLRNRVTDPENAKALETIVQQSHRCSQIVSELMAFAKPEAAKPSNLSLGPLLRDRTHKWAEQNHLAPEQMRVDLPEDLPQVRFDQEHLEQILQEVLGNSLQAAEKESAHLRVNCRAKASDEFVVMSLSDNGPGMSPDVLVKALQPFFSHRPAGRRRGLGLSRAYRLAELNGGDLWLESLPKEGTTVYVRLPIASS